MQLATEYEVEAAVPVAAGAVEVRRYRWARPLDDVYCDPDHIIGLSLSPVPPGSKARFGSSPGPGPLQPIGRLLFRPAGLPLHCVNSGGVQRLVMCNFPPVEAGDVTEDVFGKLVDARPTVNLRSETISGALQRVAAEALTPGFATAPLVEAMLTIAVVDLLRTGGGLQCERVTGGLAPWQLRRIDEALRDIDGAPPTVAALAKLTGLSPRHLLRAFRATTGSTVVHRIAQARFVRACELLTETGLPLKQVAYRSGFATPSGFAAAFKREAGVSPAEYRRRRACYL
jgi:AraC family transcriptional regulator